MKKRTVHVCAPDCSGRAGKKSARIREEADA